MGQMHYVDEIGDFYIFKNKKWQFWQIHPSYMPNPNFQGFEFFGDKLLGFYIAQILLERGLTEDKMSLYFSELVKTNTLAHLATIYLKPHIKYTGELTNSMLADCLEVFLACAYYDGANIRDLIHYMWQDLLFADYYSSYKNRVQEHLQQDGKTFEYVYEKIRDGFLCRLIINNKEQVRAVGQSKKLASEVAAELFFNLKV